MRKQGDFEHASAGSSDHGIGNTKLHSMAELSAKKYAKSVNAYGVVSFLLLLLLQDQVALEPGAVTPVAVMLTAVDLVVLLGRDGGVRIVINNTVSKARLGRRIIVTITIAGAGGQKPLSDTPTILHEKTGRMDVTFVFWATLIEGEAAFKTEEAFMAAIGGRLVAGCWCLLARFLPIARGLLPH